MIENFDISLIENEWMKDSKISEDNLNSSSAETFQLHNKYFKYLNQAKSMKRVFDAERNKMIMLLTDLYSGNISLETLKKMSWKPNPRIILKNDIQSHIDADDRMIEINNSLGEVNDIIDFTKSIIQAINGRSFVIKNIIEYRKFQNGGY